MSISIFKLIEEKYSLSEKEAKEKVDKYYSKKYNENG